MVVYGVEYSVEPKNSRLAEISIGYEMLTVSAFVTIPK